MNPMGNATRHNAIVNFAMERHSSIMTLLLASDTEPSPDDLEAVAMRLAGEVQKSFPDATPSEISAALRDVSDRIEEEAAVKDALLDQEYSHYQRLAALANGLPEGTTIGEAVRIKAEAGDAFAQRVLADPDISAKEITASQHTSDMTPAAGITPAIDALIDLFEEAGIHWYVIGGSNVVPPALAFELPPDGSVPIPALAAVQSFCRIFRTDDRAQQATIQWAISIGAYYVELGNTRPATGGSATIQ